VRAQRDNGKMLVLDIVRDVNLRAERETEQQRLRAFSLASEPEQKIERGQERGRGR